MKNLSAVHMASAALMVITASSALAQRIDNKPQKKPNVWYAGGSIGNGGYKTGYERTAATIFSTGATSATVSADAKETMWKAYVGYYVSPQFSIEGGYWNYGNPSYVANISAPVTTTMRRSFSAQGYGANTVFWMPVNDSFSGFAKIGAQLMSTKASAAEPGAGLTALPAESARKVNWGWGLGAKYDINNDFAARVEYETVRNVGDSAKFGTADVVMWSLGLNYKY